MKNIKQYCLLFLVMVSVLYGNAQNLKISGSCISNTVELTNGGDVSSITYNDKPDYYNAALPVNYQSQSISTEAHLYFALAAELGTDENRWVVSYGGQPYYYFISDASTPPNGEYLPFDAAASVSDCGGSVFIFECVTKFGDTTAVACESFTWHGMTYTTTPTVAPTYTYSTALGCDSVVTLNLTIPLGVAAPTVNAGSALSDVCPGAPSVALNGSFGGSATGAVWSDGAAGGSFKNNSGSTPGTAIYIPSVTSNGNITLTLTTTGSVCEQAVATKSFFVNGQSSWLGISNNWSDGKNWSNGIIPSACTRVIVPEGLPFMPLVSGKEIVCYKLTIQPGAKVKVTTGTNLVIVGDK